MVQKREPIPGRDVELTIDTRIQKVAETALARAIAGRPQGQLPEGEGRSRGRDRRADRRGPRDGEPAHLRPAIFLGGISQKKWRSLTTTSSEFPLTNRAIMAQYPAASTFKAFTGLAGLQHGVTSPGTTYECEGRWTDMGKQWAKWCWNHDGHGLETFMEGIKDSCDIVFYNIGYAFYKNKGEKLQKFARTFGFGKPTGIDLPGEATGRVPDAAWKREFNGDYPEYRQWLPGDTVNMAIGQGDLLVTPLQLAAAYAGDRQRRQGHGAARAQAECWGAARHPGYTEKPKVAARPKVPAADLAVMQQALRSWSPQARGRMRSRVRRPRRGQDGYRAGRGQGRLRAVRRLRAGRGAQVLRRRRRRAGRSRRLGRRPGGT